MTENFSVGQLRSFSPAATMHHFILGAQKKTVLDPVGWFINDWNLEADALATLSVSRQLVLLKVSQIFLPNAQITHAEVVS
ncbi:hypothetical protein BC827DRAFT_1231712 [Russula dissimulans]|nr:hypothetical protein BC827DRAFT_1231712 [Russula dissimulans]